MLKTPTPRRFCLIGLVLLHLTAAMPSLTGAHAAAAGMCRAPADAPPCGASAAPLGEPDLDTGLSNPIHLATGEKFLQETDIPAPVHGEHPSFVRHYRSTRPGAGILGAGWAHEYQQQLSAHGAGWRILTAEGRSHAFDARGRALDGGGHSLRVLAAAVPPEASAASTPSAAPQPAATAYTWEHDDGRRLEFDAQGRLLALHRPGRTTIRLTRHATGVLAGHLHEIKGVGTLTLRYETVSGAIRLTALDTPLGTFHYRYQSIRAGIVLQRVERPDGMRRIYHHEAEHQGGHASAITGVTLAAADGQALRIRSWIWDAQGRVKRAVPGPAGQARGALTLTYDLPGKTRSTRTTRIQAAAGQAEATYRMQGSRTLPLDILTQPCADCSPETHTVERDAHGRLTAIGGLGIDRDAGGHIRRLRASQAGWPGLTLTYDPQGRRLAWESRLTGQTRAHYDGGGRLQGLRHANGDTLDLGRDAAGRPTLLHYAGTGKTPVTVRLQWQGTRLQRLTHPAEDEIRQYDAQGRLSARTIRRPHARGTLHYREQFSHDAQGRLARHELPEGGALLYEWRGTRQLAALTWISADGARHPVITSAPGVPGYRYGNGLHLQTAVAPDAASLLLSDGPRPLWGEQRPLDTQGRQQELRQYDFTGPADGPRGAPKDSWQSAATLTRTYAYDDRHRIAGLREARSATVQQAAAPLPPSTSAWFAWADDGRRVSGAPPIRRDASGLPFAVDGHTLHYQAQRLLAEVRTAGGLDVRYTHNAQGHLIRRRQATRETERYYLDNRLVALWQRPDAGGADAPAALAEKPATFGVTQRYLYAHEVPVGLLQADARGRMRLYYIHTDLLGTPQRVTDAQRIVRWSATASLFGRTRTQGDLDLPLRLPGQDEDALTGWHHNVFRTYLPDAGHYLEPDPLGPVPGEQALGYAAQQPMRHIDPLGLILLSFDGTRYDRQNLSNVWKLTQAYEGGPAYYHAGPGNALKLDWDAITAASSGQILRTQWAALMGALQQAQHQAQPVAIDLLGYSRGAALARDFANRIARQTRNGWFSYDDPLRGTIGLCVDLRFLGLFDTVAQFGVLGAANAGYDLTISGAWQWVAHAVALHEFRSLFPLVSAADGSPGNVAEAPFLGAHADIGGGLALDDGGLPLPGGDLSDVALNWMRWQALAALVPMKALASEDQRVTQALLHDERAPMDRILENSDRVIQDAAATRSQGLQRFDPRLGAAQRQALESFIERVALWQAAPGNVVGTVDMRGYGAWLETELGLSGLGSP